MDNNSDDILQVPLLANKNFFFGKWSEPIVLLFVVKRGLQCNFSLGKWGEVYYLVLYISSHKI